MRNKKNRENTRQRKQSNAQDNIYVVRQFAYVHGVAGISLLSRKNTIHSAATIFLFIKARQPTHNNNPNHQSWFHNGLNRPKNPAWTYQPKPPLQGLSLSKSPIKNHTILFESGRIAELDQTKLGSTKPNRSRN